MELKEEIIENLKNIYDPEIPVDIYNLGLIYHIDISVVDNYTHVDIKMTLTSPGCPVADALFDQVRYFTSKIDRVDEVQVELVFEPPWNPIMVSEEGKMLLEMEGNPII